MHYLFIIIIIIIIIIPIIPTLSGVIISVIWGAEKTDVEKHGNLQICRLCEEMCTGNVNYMNSCGVPLSFALNVGQLP